MTATTYSDSAIVMSILLMAIVVTHIWLKDAALKTEPVVFEMMMLSMWLVIWGCHERFKTEAAE